MRKTFFAVAISLLAIIGNPAVADTHETQMANLARFQQYAGEPVDGFSMWKMYKWQNLGPDKLLVWTRVNEVYMLTVGQPCNRLEDAKVIAVTSQMARQVNRRLDSVNFDGQRCQILEIRPIDYKTMLKDGDSAGPATKN